MSSAVFAKTIVPADIEVIAWSKAVHMVLVVLFIFVWILTASAGPMSPAQVVGIQFLPFLLGGICDALRSPGATTAEKMRGGVGGVGGLSFAGPIAYITIMLISVKWGDPRASCGSRAPCRPPICSAYSVHSLARRHTKEGHRA